MTTLPPQADEEAEIKMSASRSFPSPLPPLAPRLDANSTRFQSYSHLPPPPAADPRLAETGTFISAIAQRCKVDPCTYATENLGGGGYSLKSFIGAKPTTPSSLSEQEQRRQQAVFHHHQVIGNQQLVSHSTELQHGTSLDAPIYFPLPGHARNISLNLATMNLPSTSSSEPSLREHQLRMQGIVPSGHTLPRFDRPPQDEFGFTHSNLNQHLLSRGVALKMTDVGVSLAAPPSHESNKHALNFIDDRRTHRVPHNSNKTASTDHLFAAASLAEMGRQCTLPSSMPQNFSRAMLDNRIGIKPASAGMVTSPSTNYHHFLNMSLKAHNSHINDGLITESAPKPVHVHVATEETRNFSLHNISSTSKIDGGMVQTKATKMRGKEFSFSDPYAVIGGPIKNPKKATKKREIKLSSSVVDGDPVTNKPIPTKNKNGIDDDFSSNFFARMPYPTMPKEHADHTGVTMGERWRTMTPEKKSPYTEMANREVKHYQRENPTIDGTCNVEPIHVPRNGMGPNNLKSVFLPTTSAFTEKKFGENSALATNVTFSTQGVDFACNPKIFTRHSAFPHGSAWEGMTVLELRVACKQRKLKVVGNKSVLVERLKNYVVEYTRITAEQSSSPSDSAYNAVFYAGEEYVANDLAVSDGLTSIHPRSDKLQRTASRSCEGRRISVACIDDSEAPSWGQPPSNPPSQESSMVPHSNDEHEDCTAPPPFTVDFQPHDEVDFLSELPQPISAPIARPPEETKLSVSRKLAEEEVSAMKEVPVKKKMGTKKTALEKKVRREFDRSCHNNDVLFVRVGANGNIRFHKKALELMPKNLSCPKEGKTTVSEELTESVTREGHHFLQKCSDGSWHQVDEKGARKTVTQAFMALPETEEGCRIYRNDLGDDGQSETKNSSMTRKNVEPIITDRQDKAFDGDGEMISKNNATEKAARKNHIHKVELVKKKKRNNGKTENFVVCSKNFENSPLLVHIPPNTHLLPSQEAMSAQAHQLNVGTTMTLNIPLLPPLKSCEKIMSTGMSQSEDLVTAQMNQSSAVRVAAVSHIPTNPHLLPSREAMSAQANQLNVGSMMTLNAPLSPPSTSSGQIVSANTNRSEVSLVFHCPKCAKDFHFAEPNSAPASFSDHVKGCGRAKKKSETPRRKMSQNAVVELYDSSPASPHDSITSGYENGMFEIANRKKLHRQHRTTRRIKERNMISSTPSDIGVRREKRALRIKNGDPMTNKSKKSKCKKESSSDAIVAKRPKSARSSYTFFAGFTRPTITEEQLSKQMVGEQWRAMTPEEKKPFMQMASQDRERYLREKTTFEEKSTERSNLKSGPTEGTGFCMEVTTSEFINAQSSYPYAPLGHLWLDKSLSSSKSLYCEATLSRSEIDSGSTLIGRRWVWDEGHFVDCHLDPQIRKKGRSGCTCGSNHLFGILNTIKNPKPSYDAKSPGRARRSERSAYSSSVTAQLADGQLDPHTLITCEGKWMQLSPCSYKKDSCIICPSHDAEEYDLGPEYRFVKGHQTESVQPFSVRINPDATFLADLHAHLCDSEIIGLLGGYYSKEEKCIYIQAAFPCKSTDRTDSGSTDVEMDPVFQIYATEAIANHGMTAVGWYHSHPDFQPNPSVTDIENQANYQQLFQGSDLAGRNAEVSPFVGLIVGTYDGRNPGSQSVMR